MASLVYILCAVTSFVVALLQWRAYQNERTPFLLWMAIGFFAMFINNALLYVDFITGPDWPLIWPRTLISLLGVCTIIYGFIWEAGRE